MLVALDSSPVYLPHLDGLPPIDPATSFVLIHPSAATSMSTREAMAQLEEGLRLHLAHQSANDQPPSPVSSHDDGREADDDAPGTPSTSSSSTEGDIGAPLGGLPGSVLDPLPRASPTEAGSAVADDDPIPGFSGLAIGGQTEKNKNGKGKDKFDVVRAWEEYFGEDTLENWARLCRDLGCKGEFTSKTKCKKAMQPIWVNIWDFVRAPDKSKVRRFESEAALSRYTMKKSSRKFPREKIGRDSPLRLLMANILYPRYGGRKGKGKV